MHLWTLWARLAGLAARQAPRHETAAASNQDFLREANKYNVWAVQMPHQILLHQLEWLHAISILAQLCVFKSVGEGVQAKFMYGRGGGASEIHVGEGVQVRENFQIFPAGSPWYSFANRLGH